jgi:hypothetical protein
MGIRTLTLMMVTDLSDAEIVLGKLASRLVAILGIVACGLPALAILTSLGRHRGRLDGYRGHGGIGGGPVADLLGVGDQAARGRSWQPMPLMRSGC